ncbi:MAG: SDR family NAD(P)-dependent oxidoreductase [Bacteroidales bacterium]|nr:SDR family NAD(P)-dependent oxidoreductase [Bacteroidales bacterium]
MLALVTGASSGMGLEYARQLAAAGNDVIIVSNQQEELVKVAAKFEEEYKVKVHPKYMDLASPDAAGDLHSWCEENSFEVELLVNNAGMFFFKELTPEMSGKVSAMMNLHMVTVTQMCILFGEDMKRRGHGRIINMSSMAAVLPMPGITIYNSTKAYLLNFGKSFWYELKPYGVYLTTVCPAAIATPLYKLKESLLNFGVKIGVIQTPGSLVRRALRASRHHRRVIKPGLMNIYLPVLIWLLPRPVVSLCWKKLKIKLGA